MDAPGDWMLDALPPLSDSFDMSATSAAVHRHALALDDDTGTGVADPEAIMRLQKDRSSLFSFLPPDLMRYHLAHFISTEVPFLIRGREPRLFNAVHNEWRDLAPAPRASTRSQWRFNSAQCMVGTSFWRFNVSGPFDSGKEFPIGGTHLSHQLDLHSNAWSECEVIFRGEHTRLFSERTGFAWSSSDHVVWAASGVSEAKILQYSRLSPLTIHNNEIAPWLSRLDPRTSLVEDVLRLPFDPKEEQFSLNATDRLHMLPNGDVLFIGGCCHCSVFRFDVRASRWHKDRMVLSPPDQAKDGYERVFTLVPHLRLGGSVDAAHEPDLMAITFTPHDRRASMQVLDVAAGKLRTTAPLELAHPRYYRQGPLLITVRGRPLLLGGSNSDDSAMVIDMLHQWAPSELQARRLASNRRVDSGLLNLAPAFTKYNTIPIEFATTVLL